jgi:plastocyanin
MVPFPTSASLVRRVSKDAFAPLVLFIACLPTGCDRDVQTVRIAVQDNRFVPNQLALISDSPISLTLVNEGREAHEFASPLFTAATTRILAIDPADRLDQRPWHLNPGNRLSITFTAPPGTHVFYCARKGHPGMSGTLILDSGATSRPSDAASGGSDPRLRHARR